MKKFLDYYNISADGMIISSPGFYVNLAIFKIKRSSLSGDINALSIEFIKKEN